MLRRIFLAFCVIFMLPVLNANLNEQIEKLETSLGVLKKKCVLLAQTLGDVRGQIRSAPFLSSPGQEVKKTQRIKSGETFRVNVCNEYTNSAKNFKDLVQKYLEEALKGTGVNLEVDENPATEFQAVTLGPELYNKYDVVIYFDINGNCPLTDGESLQKKMIYLREGSKTKSVIYVFGVSGVLSSDYVSRYLNKPIFFSDKNFPSGYYLADPTGKEAIGDWCSRVGWIPSDHWVEISEGNVVEGENARGKAYVEGEKIEITAKSKLQYFAQELKRVLVDGDEKAAWFFNRNDFAGERTGVQKERWMKPHSQWLRKK
ncbi:MAG: hypothetical protein ABH827_05270 [bacterium]